ncbi:hypothetical protein GQ600_5980 [Phytophthora cactorum]|nr:hypothetical protein GQ600_5980 [Phytophthora cactorum]
MAMDEVAASGRVDHLECCRFHGGRGCSSRAFILAASNDHLAVIRWLLVYYTDQYHPTSIAHASGAVSHWLCLWKAACHQVALCKLSTRWNMTGVADNAAKLGWSDEIINVYVEPKALVYASHAWTSIWLVCAAPVACLPLHHFTGQV